MTIKRPGVLDPEAAEYVLPAPPRTGGEVVVVAPSRDGASSWRRGAEVARALGDRFLLHLENQQLLLTELRERLAAFDAALAEATRAQLKGSVRELLAVLDWSDAIQSEAIGEARLAAAGAEPLDVADVCRAVAARTQTAEQPIHVQGEVHGTWWGPATALAELVRHAVALVGERTQGVGARRIDVSDSPTTVRIAVASCGEPGDAIDPDTIERFRRSVAELGASVRPGPDGVGGNGLVLELARAAAAV